MKKSDFILIGIVVLIVILSLFSTKGNMKLEKVKYPLTLVGDAGLHEIDYKQYNKFIDNQDAFILVIEREGCRFCTAYMPIVEEVANEKKIPIYFIDIAKMTSADLNDFTARNSYLKKTSDWGTPTTLLMLGNRDLDVIASYVEKDQLLSFIEGKVVVGE